MCTKVLLTLFIICTTTLKYNIVLAITIYCSVLLDLEIDYFDYDC